MEPRFPLVAIVGPTASGKTALAVEQAEKHGAEIICADSRTVYKEFDIGTAKPSDKDRARVPHWGLDLVSPRDSYNASMYKKYADKCILDIRTRDRQPFLVGGTGLYVNSVVYNFTFGRLSNPAERAKLEALTIQELWEICRIRNILLPENYKNKRYVIRSIENMVEGRAVKDVKETDAIVVGIATDKDILRERIEQRTEQLFENGVVEEAIRLGNKYGWDNSPMSGNVYQVIRKIVDGTLTQDEAIAQVSLLDWQLAKRQITFFKKDKNIKWLNLRDASLYLNSVLR